MEHYLETTETITQDKPAVKRSGRHVGLFLIIYQLFVMIAGVFFTEVSRLVREELGLPAMETFDILIGTAIAQLLGLILFGLFWLFHKGPIKQTKPAIEPLPVGYLKRSFLWLVGINMLLVLFNHLVYRLSGRTLGLSIDWSDTPGPLFLFLMLAVFPAIVEEIMYRRILFRYLKRHGFWFGAISSSILFGLIHQNILQFLFATAVGVILCLVYERSGRLIYPILLHLLNNAITVLQVSLPISAEIVQWFNLSLGVLSLVLIGRFISIHRQRLQNGWQAMKAKLGPMRYFFTSVPMLLLTLALLWISIMVIFID